LRYHELDAHVSDLERSLYEPKYYLWLSRVKILHRLSFFFQDKAIQSEMISTLLTTFNGPKTKALPLPPSYGKIFKIFEPHGRPRIGVPVQSVQYSGETYSTSTSVQYFTRFYLDSVLVEPSPASSPPPAIEREPCPRCALLVPSVCSCTCALSALV